MFVYIYSHVTVRIHAFEYVNVYLSESFQNSFMHLCDCVCVHVCAFCVYLHMELNFKTCICASKCPCICVRLFKYACEHMHVCTCSYALFCTSSVCIWKFACACLQTHLVTCI